MDSLQSSLIINGKVPYDNSMELSFKELTKRDVINVSDGRCLGRMTDLKLEFPKGNLSGIVVPGRKMNFIFRLFDKSELFIPVSKILKIGGDAILVDLDGKERREPKPHGVKPPVPPCPPVPPFPPSPCPPDPCEAPFLSGDDDDI